MQRSKFDLMVLIIIVIFGMAAAYLTFGILSSQAKIESEHPDVASPIRYSVGGALAGFLLTVALLTSLYLQLSKFSQQRELRELRGRNDELQGKLIRGVPCPPGFDIEVSERQKIVLARPGESPGGGTIFDFEQSAAKMKKNDHFPARFSCWFMPITVETKPQDDYYNNFAKSFRGDSLFDSSINEYIYLGGADGGVKSLKVTVRESIKITETKEQTGRINRVWNVISRQEYEEGSKNYNQSNEPKLTSSVLPEKQVEHKPVPEQPDSKVQLEIVAEQSKVSATATGTAVQAAPETPRAETEDSEIWFALIQHTYVVCYHQQLHNIFWFEFLDDEMDYIESSSTFNQILTSARFLT
jgi:hypothetical protein